jgi:hypothetical protein
MCVSVAMLVRRAYDRGFAGDAAPPAAAASRFSWQLRQRVMPRMSQMTQMKVPQSTQG